MSIDLVDELDYTQDIKPQTIDTNTTTNGSGFDRNSSPALRHAVVFSAGTLADGDFALKVQEQDDGGSWSDVASADLDGSLSDFTSSNDEKKQVVGYLGTKDQIRAVITTTNVTNGGEVEAYVVSGTKRDNP